MSGERRAVDPSGQSVAMAAEKARSERVARLTATLERRLENPLAAIDQLMAEVSDGDLRADLWERLHAAAMRDQVEDAVADAYVKCTNGPRMKRLSPDAQAVVLMHAADYFQGVRGDAKAAQHLLDRVLRLVPGHPEAFARLERRLEKLLDSHGLLQLYASVATTPPKAPNVLATQVYNRVLQLAGKGKLPDETCTQLVALVPHHPRLLDALETHCVATKRAALACSLIERALATGSDDTDILTQRRHRLLELYSGDAGTPAAAMPHVEQLLERDPSDPVALKVAERLLSVRDVASRAAAALQSARRSRNH